MLGLVRFSPYGEKVTKSPFIILWWVLHISTQYITK
nr:MAG TPA: hypothetical protein [Caudoviricetes sp.]